MNILFITATRIGDAVLSTGVISDLASHFPDARLTIACGVPAAPLFETVPNLDRLIVTEKMPLHGHWLRLWLAAAATRWDVVCDLRGSALSRFIFARRRIVGTYRDESIHRVEELGQLMGISPPPTPRLWLSDADRAAAQSLMPDTEHVLAIGPTANWGGKQWSPKRFAALAERATAPGGILPGAHVAVLGSLSERDMAQTMLDALPEERLLDLMGQPLRISAACIERSALYGGNDSGLMHIAAAVGTPTLGLFGPSSEIRYGPWGNHCAAVRTPEAFKDIVMAHGFDHTSQRSLMESLTVEAVYMALEKLYISVKSEPEREA
ncbi:MAG: glycosyltransferase family 9 protein [Pseudomonadota bacterium]|nr:glycosyltransferase family 9 protein [Pseudomonadota bacterium]